jgi:tetratricopeptide (TPR) repeat protein
MKYSEKNIDMLLSSLPGAELSPGFDEAFDLKLQKAIEVSLQPKWHEIVFDMVQEFIDSIPVVRVPVFAKAIVSIAFTVGALYTGLYYGEIDTPYISGIQGEAFIFDDKTDTWGSCGNNARLKKGAIIKSGSGSTVDITLGKKYSMRLKSGSVIKLQKLTPKHRRGIALVDLRKGNVLVDIGKAFKGSKFRVKTPLTTLQALGTKFMVSSDNDEKTWVGVLEGTVRAESFQVAQAPKNVFIQSGMKLEIEKGKPITSPIPFIRSEWQEMFELYDLGEKTKVALIISTNKNRVLELLSPCPIYISDSEPRTIPRELEESVRLIQKAVKTGNIDMHIAAIEKLEQIVALDGKQEYNVKLLLFIGAYYHYLEKPDKSITIFDQIIKQYPRSALVSLAICAKAYILETSLNNSEKAKKLYSHIIRDYPTSPEAIFAEDHIQDMTDNRMA